MSWGVKYRLSYNGLLDITWKHDFLIEDYSGEITMLKGSRTPATFIYDSDDLFTPICASSVDFEIIEYTDEQFQDYFLQDRMIKIKSYKNDVLFWQGWSIAHDCRTKYTYPPKIFAFTAVDGITFLHNKRLTITSPGIVQLYTFFKQAFDYIDLDASIYECLDVYGENDDYDDSPLFQKRIDSWAFYDPSNWTYNYLYDVLEKLLVGEVGGRLYQRNGIWYIDRVSKMTTTEEIIYRTYTSAFVPIKDGSEWITSDENRVKEITSAKIQPISTPVNESLIKELERPYSEFTLTADFQLRENILRYPDIFTANILYDIELERKRAFYYEKTLKIDYQGYPPTNSQGIKYSLGYVKFLGDVYDPLFTFSITCRLLGTLRIKLYIENEDDSISYMYTHNFPVNPALNRSWSAFGANSRDTLYLHDLMVLQNTTNEEVTETVDIFVGDAPLEGQMYLLINPPNSLNHTVQIDLESLNISYSECNRISEERKIVLEEFHTNKREKTIQTYSAVRKYGESESTYAANVYENPHLAYPGMYYNSDDQESFHTLFFIKGINNTGALENLIMQDIMTYYSTMRLRVTGTIISELDYGNVISYKNKLYLIMYFQYDTLTSFAELTLLEISVLQDFLVTESGDYILTESGDYILIE